MALPAGTRLGPYEITSPLGAGGMGEVYRARDTRLGREVAVKVLPSTVVGNPEAWSRFEREAQAVASLSHANILAIHDFGVEAGTAYSVTELLEGATLRDMLADGPLPVRKVVDYGSQVALGLAAAHEKGIVHRDLKPENIFITHDGRAKILDFGLAKIERPANADSTVSPTLTAATLPGTVLGTMAYMSPEQVRGREVDARSDIFSFGSVLYEMLTGSTAFRRDTAADTLSAILKEDPPAPGTASQEIPPALQRIVEHCVEKNPAERFQSARDLAFHLDAVGTTSSSSASVMPVAFHERRPRRSLRAAALLLAGLIVGALLGALVAIKLRKPERFEPPRVEYLSYSGRDADPSASPDGKLIAYASVHGGRRQIWLKQYPGGDEVALTAGPEDGLPRISPDGSQVLFTRTEGVSTALYKVPIVGGEPRKIVDDAYDGDWSPDGRNVVFVRDRTDASGLTSSLWTVDAAGQGSRQIAELQVSQLTYPRWSPDGKTIVVVKAATENAPFVLLLVPASGGEIRALTPPPPAGRLSAPAWVDDGDAILYSQSGSFASGANQGVGRVIVHPLRGGQPEVKMWLPNSASGMDLLGDGSLVFGVFLQRQNLVEKALDDPAAPAQAITRGNSVDRQPVYSRDGKWVLFSSNRGGDLDLWKLEVATGAIRRITEDASDDWDPAFTPDGKSILWSSNRGGHFEIWICASDGTGSRQFSHDGFDAENPTVTPDGEWVVYNSSNPEQSGLWKVHLDGTGAARIIAGSFSTPDVSPDGKHVAFRTGRIPRTLYIARVEDGEMVIPPIDLPGGVTNGRPRWMPDGKRFVYAASDERGAQGIYVQDFVPGQDTTATRRPLLEFAVEEPAESFGIAPDGTRVVYSRSDSLESLMLAAGLNGVERPRPQPR